MNTPRQLENLTAIILVGGQSKRMGTDKSFLKFDKQDFISAVIGHAEKMSDKLLIVCGKHNQSLFKGSNLKVIRDEISGMGPIMGMITGFKNVKTKWVLVLSVDTPFFTNEMMQRLWENKADFQGVIYRDKAGIHPLNALYDISTFKDWEAAYNRGDRKLTDVLKNLNIRYIPVVGKASLKLRNINTKEEYNAIIDQKD